MKEKALREMGLKALDQREEILRAKFKAGTPVPFAEAHRELKTIAKIRGFLNDKARLEDSGSKRVDRLAERLTEARLKDAGKTADWLAYRLTKVEEGCLEPDWLLSW